jgi:DNA-binding HxlR family transcriptional regulator
MTRQSFADVDCGVAQAVDQLGDKWTLVILRSAFAGIRRFDEFIEHLGIAANILSNRLCKLVEVDILRKQKVEGDRRAVEYVLTSKGLDTYPMIVFLNQWSDRWMGSAKGRRIQILERDTDRPIRDVQILAESGKALTASEIYIRSDLGGSDVLTRCQTIVARRRSSVLR